MERKILFEGKYRRLVCRDGWEYVERVQCGGVVVIIPVTGKGQVVLTEQYRIPLGKNVIEFPAGLRGDEAHNRDESLEDGAKRELLEETGFYNLIANVENKIKLIRTSFFS